MKKLFILLFSISVYAQDYGNNAETLKLCTTLQTNSFSSNLDADTALERILDVVGLSKNFVLAPCSDINNAVAVSFKGVRYILYDPEFMSMLSRNTSNWTNLFILAHEVGHHVNGHSLDLVLYAGEIVDAPELKKKREQELEADEFAGFVLAKLGASLAQTKLSVSRLSNEDDIYRTHPKRDKRLASIEKGWNEGYKLMPNNKNNIEISPQKNNFKTYSWKYKLEEPNKGVSNPFNLVNEKLILTSTITASLIEDNRKTWTNLPKKIYRGNKWLFKKNPRLPKLIIEQSIDYENNKTVKYFVEGLIDLQMLKASLYSLKQQYRSTTNIDKIINLNIQVKINQNTYTFRCFTPNIFEKISLSDTSVVRLYPLNSSGFGLIDDLKVAKNAYFKISKKFTGIFEVLEYNPISRIDWNTYYIDLNGSFEALSF